jgi:hypothetical protein
MRLSTPVTNPTLPDYETVREARAMHLRRARIRIAVLAGLAALLAIALLTMVGCAHQPNPAAEVVVLNERIGGPVAQALELLTGQEPKAITAPYLPTIVLQPRDANDPCLLEHEGVHRLDQVDMGGVEWAKEYARELVDCRRTRPSAECLRTIPLEAKAYAKQHACMAGSSRLEAEAHSEGRTDAAPTVEIGHRSDFGTPGGSSEKAAGRFAKGIAPAPTC